MYSYIKSPQVHYSTRYTSTCFYFLIKWKNLKSRVVRQDRLGFPTRRPGLVVYKLYIPGTVYFLVPITKFLKFEKSNIVQDFEVHSWALTCWQSPFTKRTFYWSFWCSKAKTWQEKYFLMPCQCHASKYFLALMKLKD